MTDDKPEILVKEWRPHRGPQEEALRMFYVDELLYGGAKGGGKTDCLLFDFAHPQVIDKPNYKGIIFRRTFPRLQEIIDRSYFWFSKKGVYNSQNRCWTFFSGAKLYFGHCQREEDKYQYDGQEYQYMGFDQVEQFTKSQFERLTTCVRSTDINIPVRIRCTANPGNVGHLWVKDRWISGKEPFKIYKNKEGLRSIFIPAKVYDNPTLLKNDPAYLARLKSLPLKDRQALLDGDWDIFEGQFFNEWNPDVHITTDLSWQELPRRTVLGLDYGYSKPSSVGWYAVLPEGLLVRYKELYIEKQSYESLAELVLEMSREELGKQNGIDYCVADPAIWGDKSHHIGQVGLIKDKVMGISGAETMQRVFGDKIHIIKADNSRVIGWGRMRDYLKPFINQHNQLTAKLRVMATCSAFIQTVPGLVHSETMPEDCDSAGEDHVADETRYVVMSRPLLPTVEPKALTSDEEFWNRVKRDRKKHQSRQENESELQEITADDLEVSIV